MARSLTERQWEILLFIDGHIRSNGYSPTLEEIANQFGFRINAAKCHLLLLEKKRVIRRTPGVGRSIVVIEVPLPPMGPTKKAVKILAGYMRNLSIDQADAMLTLKQCSS